MSGAGAGYDLSANTFSPEGKIYQVEYAAKAVENSGTVLGVACTNGVLLAVEKLKLSKMLVKGSNRRTAMVDRHCGISFSGYTPDGRRLTEYARKECVNYRQNFGEEIPVGLLASRIGSIMHTYTLYGSARPFGASIVVGGYDEQQKTNELYVVEPTGVCTKYFGAAVGKGESAAKTEIGKYNIPELPLEEAVKYAAKVLHSIHDSFKDKPFEMEMAVITAAGFQFVADEIRNAAEEWAISELEKDEDKD